MDSVMFAQDRPYLGSLQPSTGSNFLLRSAPMGRRSKKNRPPAIIQGVLADNIRRLRDRKYAVLPNETARNRALAKDAETTLSQVQRIISCALAPGVDMVEQLANALDVRPQDLLTPYFTSAPAAVAQDEVQGSLGKPPKSPPFKNPRGAIGGNSREAQR